MKSFKNRAMRKSLKRGRKLNRSKSLRGGKSLRRRKSLRRGKFLRGGLYDPQMKPQEKENHVLKMLQNISNSNWKEDNNSILNEFKSPSG